VHVTAQRGNEAWKQRYEVDLRAGSTPSEPLAAIVAEHGRTYLMD
jgi:hypothetical protein